MNKIKMFRIKVKIKPRIKPRTAPLEQDFALSGYSSFHTSHKIIPANGMKKLKSAQPKLGASAILKSSLVFAPHFGQYNS